jgi:hypothetical protein
MHYVFRVFMLVLVFLCKVLKFRSFFSGILYLIEKVPEEPECGTLDKSLKRSFLNEDFGLKNSSYLFDLFSSFFFLFSFPVDLSGY